jgi:hypothetical protein
VVDEAHPVKYVPAWFPGGGFHNFAAQARADSRQVRDKPLEVVTAAMVSHFQRLAPLSFTEHGT